MPNLARDLKVVRLARELGLAARGDCLVAIASYAIHQVDQLVQASPFAIENLDTLRRVVANKFRAQVEVIETDEDVARIAEEHADFSPHLRERLIEEFLDRDTEGITLQRESHDPFRSRFLVVVDARGERSARAYFTAWHELTHLLVHPPQLAIPGFRRAPLVQDLEKDPIEQVVDHVAGQAAFYEPLFRPAAEAAITDHGRLTFAAIEDARVRAGIPRASLYASAIQTISYSCEPTALVTVGLVFKPSEQRRLRSPQGDLGLAPAAVPTQRLRVTAYITNAAADGSGLSLWRNLRVPEASVLWKAFTTAAEGTWVADEDQSWWATSEKGALPALPIRVEAIRRGRFVYGLISASA